MRTHQDHEKLKHKAEARRERLRDKKQEQRREKVRAKRQAPADDEAEIERRKAAFQAKKARRLARREAAAGAEVQST